MKKIPSLFLRDHYGVGIAPGNSGFTLIFGKLVRDEINPECQWVIDGQGRATRKYDGTCCLVRGGKLFKRYEKKPGKAAPTLFEVASEIDSVTGKQQGWLPVDDSPGDQYHREAWKNGGGEAGHIPDGTYELLGPKIQGNPDGSPMHHLLVHGYTEQHGVPLDFNGLRRYLELTNIEGIVWHHPDGRMAKIKARDFGILWPR